jgi:hypothetical protein
MPDPLLFLQSLGAAALVSALCVLAVAAHQRPVTVTRLTLACGFAFSLGVFSGCALLHWRLPWPPVNALDRFVAILLPACLSVEFVLGIRPFGPAVAWALRSALAAVATPILLHGSIYLTGSDNASAGLPGLLVPACGGLLAAEWALLAWLSRRSGSGVSISASLCLCILCSGFAVMLGGYLKGGAAAFPLVGSLAAVTLASRWKTPGLAPVVLSLGVLCLFGIVGIGHFFGRLSSDRALVLFLAPLLCWLTELPALRNRPVWVIGFLRLLLVAIPLLAVLTLAKRDFDQKMAPLLGQVPPQTDHAGDSRVSAQHSVWIFTVAQIFPNPDEATTDFRRFAQII